MVARDRVVQATRWSLTCSSMRKCGLTATLKASAACAIFSQGVIPPTRATSTWTIPAAPAAR